MERSRSFGEGAAQLPRADPKPTSLCKAQTRKGSARDFLNACSVFELFLIQWFTRMKAAMPITIECNFCRRRVKNRLQIPLCASVRRARGFAPLLVRLRTLRFAKLRLIRAVRSFAQDDTRGDGAPDDTRGMRFLIFS